MFQIHVRKPGICGCSRVSVTYSQYLQNVLVPRTIQVLKIHTVSTVQSLPHTYIRIVRIMSKSQCAKWTLLYIASGRASASFKRCLGENGNFYFIDELWTIIKEYMVPSHWQLMRRRALTMTINTWPESFKTPMVRRISIFTFSELKSNRKHKYKHKHKQKQRRQESERWWQSRQRR